MSQKTPSKSSQSPLTDITGPKQLFDTTLGVSDAWKSSSSALKAYFCDGCGCLLPLGGADDYIQCEMCGHQIHQTAMVFRPIMSRSTKKTDRQLKRQAERTRDSSQDTALAQRPMVDASCPNCDHVGLYFFTIQLRSADEGATTFYDCPSCHHKFNEN